MASGLDAVVLMLQKSSLLERFLLTICCERGQLPYFINFSSPHKLSVPNSFSSHCSFPLSCSFPSSSYFFSSQPLSPPPRLPLLCLIPISHLHPSSFPFLFLSSSPVLLPVLPSPPSLHLQAPREEDNLKAFRSALG